ncbi:MAG: dihydropteroate synthase [Tannerella sp.]|nr:dihydropteroate synthase [Tannerella sp.]
MNGKTLNIGGELLSLETPLVMGILNITSNSFYAASRKQTEGEILCRAEEILSEGGRIIDLGACSTHPGAAPVSAEEELKRLLPALHLLKKHYPQAIVSVDTFRALVARRAVEEGGADIVNDIAGGGLDADMFRTVASLRVPYILMHLRGDPQTMQQLTDYDNLIVDIRKYFADKLYELELLGVNDVIIDPGFGFSKTLEQNYELLAGLKAFAVFDRPILCGISRKAMIYRLLETGPEESLEGTTVLNTLSLLGGADILRVHDVRAAVETLRLVSKYKEYAKPCGCCISD